MSQAVTSQARQRLARKSLVAQERCRCALDGRGRVELRPRPVHRGTRPSPPAACAQEHATWMSGSACEFRRSTAAIRASVRTTRSPTSAWSIKKLRPHSPRFTGPVQVRAWRHVLTQPPRAVLRSNHVAGSAVPTVKSASTCFRSSIGGFGSASTKSMNTWASSRLRPMRSPSTRQPECPR